MILLTVSITQVVGIGLFFIALIMWLFYAVYRIAHSDSDTFEIEINIKPKNTLIQEPEDVKTTIVLSISGERRCLIVNDTKKVLEYHADMTVEIEELNDVVPYVNPIQLALLNDAWNWSYPAWGQDIDILALKSSARWDISPQYKIEK